MAPTDTPSKAPEPAVVEAVPAQTAAPEPLNEATSEAALKRLEELDAMPGTLNTQQQQERQALQEEIKKSTETADDQAAEALLDTVEEARVAFLAKLEAFEKTIPTNEGDGLIEAGLEAGKRSLLTSSVEDAKSDLSALIGDARGEGSVGEKIKEATTARDAEDFEKAQTAMDDANTAIMDKIDAIIAKETESKSLSGESQKAYTALADEAKLFMPKLQSAFDARETSLKAMETIQEKKPEPAVAETKTTPPATTTTPTPVTSPKTSSTGAPAATVPPTPATPPATEIEGGTVATAPSTTVPAAPTTASTPTQQTPASAPSTTASATASAAPAPAASTPETPPTATTEVPTTASEEAESQIVALGNPSAILGRFLATVNGFNPKGWKWTGSERSKTQCGYVTEIQTTISDLQSKATEVQTTMARLIQERKFEQASTTFDTFYTKALTPARIKIEGTLPFIEGGEPLFQSFNVVIDALTKYQKSCTDILTRSKTSAPAPAPDTTTPEKPETAEEKKVREDQEKKQEKEEKLKIMVEQIQQIKNTAAEAFAKKDMGAIVMVAFQALALLMSAFGENGDVFLFGEAMGKALSDGSKAIPKTPSEFLNLVLPKEVAKDMVKMFRSLTMEQLYAFYQAPDEKPKGISQENFEKLKAFKADHSKEFDDFFNDLFGKYKGKEYAENPQTKDKNVITFVQDKMTAWVKGLPAELLNKWRGTQESED